MNKTIKIIDLINKIANGEEVPKKIKHWKTEYQKLDDDTFVQYRNKDGYCLDLVQILNDEVEIIVDEDINIQDIEETEIELDKYNTKFYKYNNNGATESGYGFNYSCNDIETREKINDLIKAVKKLDKEIHKN